MRLSHRIDRVERTPRGACRICGRTDPKTRLDESPEWQELQAAIVKALKPFPEAKQAVLAAIHELDGGATT